MFVDRETGLISAYRMAAPIHAFGSAFETETRVGDWREVNGALFPLRFDEHVIATGERLADQSGGWVTFEANVSLPLDYFSPPAEPPPPLARMLNAAYAARMFPTDALGWYRDFRRNPKTAGADAKRIRVVSHSAGTLLAFESSCSSERSSLSQ